MAGQQVGELVICPARGESAVSAADARVIAALIAPVAAIVHAAQLTRRLAAAHDRTLAAAQQERPGSGVTCMTGSALRCRVSRSAWRR